MGCMMSKEVSQSPEVAHLKIRRKSRASSKSTNQSMIIHSRSISNIMDSEVSPYHIDTMPMNINGILHVVIKPQDLTLCFKMTASGDNICFQLVEVFHHNRYSAIVEVMSEQILLPLCLHQNIAQVDGILHLFRNDELHLRILQSRLGKIWFIEDNKLLPFAYSLGEENWNIMITDHNEWSTSHV